MATQMKKLVVMRHGHAEARAASDAQRPLTDEGRRAARAVAKQLRTFFAGCGPVAIHHSPFLRTTQTAELLCDALDCLPLPQLYAADELLGANTPQAVLHWIDTGSIQNAVLLSHQPLVSRLVAWLVDADSSAVAGQEYPMSPASCACLEFEHAAEGMFKLRHIG